MLYPEICCHHLLAQILNRNLAYIKLEILRHQIKLSNSMNFKIAHPSIKVFADRCKKKIINIVIAITANIILII